MIKYAKILNSKTGLCEVGLGDNSTFYKSIGMVEMEVEKSKLDSQWYLTEKLQTDEYKDALAELDRQNKIIEIKHKLEELDMKSIRALRAREVEKLTEYENQAKSLREQLNSL